MLNIRVVTAIPAGEIIYTGLPQPYDTYYWGLLSDNKGENLAKAWISPNGDLTIRGGVSGTAVIGMFSYPIK